MTEITVRIIGSNGRAVRALYRETDVSGPFLGKDPIIAEAIKAWQASGAPDSGDVVVTLSADPGTASEAAKGPTVPIDTAAGIVDIGGGWYELPDGSRVRGKKKALEAAAERA